MYTEADGLNYVCSTRYNGGSYPDFLSFFVTSKSAQDKEYRLRWKDGNLVAVIPDNHDIDSATYTYDRMSNPFNGVFWPDQWQEDNFLMQAPSSAATTRRQSPSTKTDKSLPAMSSAMNTSTQNPSASTSPCQVPMRTATPSPPPMPTHFTTLNENQKNTIITN